MMSSLRFRHAVILALGLSGLVAPQIVAQDAPAEPTGLEATGNLIVPQIDAPAAPPITEEEAAARELTPDVPGATSFNDFTPPDMSASADDEYRTCSDREPRPEWIAELTGFEAGRGLLVMRIYEARNYERIVTTGDCSCATKAPSWDTAEAEYQEDYAALDLQAVDQAENEFRQLKNELRREARRICEAQGNW